MACFPSVIVDVSRHPKSIPRKRIEAGGFSSGGKRFSCSSRGRRETGAGAATLQVRVIRVQHARVVDKLKRLSGSTARGS